MVWPNNATLSAVDNFLWDSLQRGLSRGEVVAFSTCCQNLSELGGGCFLISSARDLESAFMVFSKERAMRGWSETNHGHGDHGG